MRKIIIATVTLVGTLSLQFNLVNAQIENPFSYPVSFTQNLDDSDTVNFSVKNSKLIKEEKNQIKESDLTEGVISPDKKFVAFTSKNIDRWGIKPFIYIYEFNSSKVINKIPIEVNEMDRYVSSWSNNQKYILLVNKSQSLGEGRGEIYEISNKKHLYSIEMYDSKVLWDEDNLIYTTSTKDCLKVCRLKNLSLSKFKTSNGKVENLKVLREVQEELPIPSEITKQKGKFQLKMNVPERRDTGLRKFTEMLIEI